MKRNMLLGVVMLGVMLMLSAGNGQASEVSQGKCLIYDVERKSVTIEEYDIQFSNEFPYGRPTGVESIYDLATAQIGIKPAVGDILRVAYVIKGSEKVALKVMNVSKQDLRKK
jgi:hypothetical protein